MNDSSVVPASPAADVSRVQWLTTIVRARILAGRYRPGAWIREVELQREFSLSNGPVREALQGVVADGLAERAPFRGVRVIDLDEREIVELFEVRFALLGFAAELAAERAGPDVAETAAALMASLRAAPSGDAPEAWLRGDLSQWVFELAGNARLHDAYRRPLLQSLLYVGVAHHHERDADPLLTYVGEVVDAIVRREPAAAREAVRRLTEQTLRHLRRAAPHGND